MNRVEIYADAIPGFAVPLRKCRASSVELSSGRGDVWGARIQSKFSPSYKQLCQVRARLPNGGDYTITGVVFNRPNEALTLPVQNCSALEALRR